MKKISAVKTNRKKSIKIRFLTTLVANVLRIFFSFITGMVIARDLGPGEYGNFNFLLINCLALFQLVDMASLSAFYTFISQKQRGYKFLLYYSGWIFAQLIVLLLIVLFLPDFFMGKIWLGQSRSLVLLALLASYFMHCIWRFSAQIGESVRDTVGVQFRNIILAVAYLACVLVLKHKGLISVTNVLILNISLYIFCVVGYGLRLYRQQPFSRETEEKFADVFREFKVYCLPMVLCAWFGFLFVFADRWFLQKFAGSVEQGYYSIGAKIAAISLIATTSFLQILWKEVAETYAQGNMERVRMLYCRISRGLFFLSAIISCFLIPFSKEILNLLFGPNYQSAWLSFSIMLVFPVHQSLGQVNGTMLLSMGKTKAQSLIGIFFMIISIIAAYILLAPRTFVIPGFSMGATGLAIKMVVCQLIGVNIMQFFVARYIGSKFNWGYQFIILSLFLPAGFICKFLACSIYSSCSTLGVTLVVFAISMVFYALAIGATLCLYPSLVGLKREQLKSGLVWIRTRFN